MREREDEAAQEQDRPATGGGEREEEGSRTHNLDSDTPGWRAMRRGATCLLLLWLVLERRDSKRDEESAPDRGDDTCVREQRVHVAMRGSIMCACGPRGSNKSMINDPGRRHTAAQAARAPPSSSRVRLMRAPANGCLRVAGKGTGGTEKMYCKN